MIRVERYLFDLLLEHDCVSIPDFGGLVAQRFRAEINSATHILRPPTKRISFHEGLTANASLLINALAEGEKISFDAAKEAIRRQVKSWHIELATGASIKLELIGRFYLDKQNNICFNQSLEANFDLDTFGLEIFRATTINRDSHVKEAVQTVLTERLRNEIKKPFPYWRAAAVFAGIGALLAVGFFKSEVNLNDKLMATFNPLHFSRAIEMPAATERKLPAPKETITYEEASQQISNEDTKIEEPVVPVETLTTPVIKVQRYQVIVGSFKDVYNAQDLISQLERVGYHPQIIPDGDFTKVSIQGFNNRSSAVAALAEYKTKVNKGAWIYTAK